MRARMFGAFLPALALALTPLAMVTNAPVAAAAASPQSFGPNVHIFSPAMDQPEIQSELNQIAVAQVDNQFGSRRDAVLFEPGTYGSKASPLIFQVGYYTTVAGLGVSPGDVVINGAVDVFNHCVPGHCDALTNFWRSLSNLTINVTLPRPAPTYVPASPDPFGADCDNSNEIWAVSQAAPIRRVAMNGFTTLFDYCGPDDFASGGFIADSKFNGVLNGSQQQWIIRNSKIDFWTNAVWNQVFSGVIGAPAQSFPNPTFTTLASSPVTREAPYLYLDSSGAYNVFVPAVQTNSSGTTWANGPTPGTSLPLGSFYIASPADSAATINNAIQRGKNLLLTPGVYHLDQAIAVTRPDSVVIGLGMPTLVPTAGNAAMTVASAKGMLVSGVIFDAGPVTSPELLRVGDGHARSDNELTDPSGLYDVFFRIGGATPGSAATALVVNSNNVILDDIWAWRADHGNGVGWTANTSDTGVIVNGDNVTAYGLFVEHFQKTEVVWNGSGGTDVFFQNEMPYDVPSQAAWMEAPGVDGYPAFQVAPGVTSFAGYGMGSYSFFNQGIDIFAAHAFEVPGTLPVGSLHDLLTIFLDPTHGKGGILHVVNDTGGSSTIANPDTPVTVVSYP
jgi:hypothetical protein